MRHLVSLCLVFVTFLFLCKGHISKIDFPENMDAYYGDRAMWGKPFKTPWPWVTVDCVCSSGYFKRQIVGQIDISTLSEADSLMRFDNYWYYVEDPATKSWRLTWSKTKLGK